MIKSDLDQTEFNAYYAQYLDKLPVNTNLMESFAQGKKTVIEFFRSIPSNKLEYRYESDKWSVKEILQHLIDTERIFLHRCFRIARNDRTPLTGFDQNAYVEPSGADQKSIDELLDEFSVNRDHSIILLKSLSDENLKFTGNASGYDLSARAAAFIIPGHDLWHIDIIKERYL